MGSRKHSRNESGYFLGKSRKVKNQSVLKWADWVKEFTIEFLNQCKFGLYMTFVAFIYTHIIRDAFPGRFSEIFLVIAMIHGCNLGIRQKSAIISKILSGMSSVLLSSDNSK